MEENAAERRARMNRERPLISFAPSVRTRIERIAGRAGFSWKEQVRAWVRLAMEAAETAGHMGDHRARSCAVAPVLTATLEAATIAALRDSGVRETPEEALPSGARFEPRTDERDGSVEREEDPFDE